MKTETAQPGLPTAVLKALQDELKKYPEIRQAILFGSRAKETHKTGSDIDLCLVEEGLSFNHYLNLKTSLEDRLFPHSLDLILKTQIENPDLQEHINRTGKAIYQAQPL